MPRYKITIEYLGTNFKGWQRQKSSYSVQEAIENSAEKLLQQKIKLVVAGRTDAGVHAEGQVAHFDLKKKFCSRKIQLGINFFLKSQKHGTDISIKKVTQVKKNFNARFSAKKKNYQYLIFNNIYRSPILLNHSWWVVKKLNHKKMQEASQYLIGNHNFSSFRSKGCQAKTPYKTLDKIVICRKSDLIKISFLAKSFLYNQVRIMVGTLKDVGTGKLEPKEIINILKKQDRLFSGTTAPSKGLTLKKITY